jgi:probable HAF family extracellular repeat protein
MRDIGTLGGHSSSAYGINNNGQIVGDSYIRSNIADRAFLYSNGVMQDLGELHQTNIYHTVALWDQQQGSSGRRRVHGKFGNELCLPVLRRCDARLEKFDHPGKFEMESSRSKSHK